MTWSNRFWRTKSFKTRLIVAIGIIAIIGLGLLTPNLLLLRIVYGFAAVLAIMEIDSFTAAFTAPTNLLTQSLLPLMSAFAIGVSIFSAFILPSRTFFLVFLTAYGADVMGYLCGNLFGGHLTKTRPFPKTSPKKTWEGLFASALAPVLLISIVNLLVPSHDSPVLLTDWTLMLAGFVAVDGDYFASFLKRACGVKDSGQILANRKGFRFFETLLGGANGHGGYLDRVDSLSTVMLFASFIYVLAPALTSTH